MRSDASSLGWNTRRAGRVHQPHQLRVKPSAAVTAPPSNAPKTTPFQSVAASRVTLDQRSGFWHLAERRSDVATRVEERAHPVNGDVGIVHGGDTHLLAARLTAAFVFDGECALE